jgi:hypothetical protein
MNLKELDKEYGKLKRAIEAIKAADARFEKSHGVNGMDNPFDVYALERAVGELRERFIRFAVRLVRKALCKNVQIDPDNVRDAMNRELGPLSFSTTWIVRHVERVYASRQRELALEQIRSELKRRLPWIEVDGSGYKRERPEKPEEIVRGRSIVFNVHLFTGQGTISRHEVPAILAALGKAARIAIEGEAPEDADGIELPQGILEARSPDDFFRSHELGGLVEAIRFCKKGSIEARFRTPEEALQVAALVLG